MSERSTAVIVNAGGWNRQSSVSLCFLTVASMYNYLDRSLFGFVMPLIKADLRLSDTVLGLLSGLAFAILHAVFTIPIAWLADRSDRRLIVSVGFAFWSLMTALSGLVSNAWQMAAARMMMGAGEASSFAPSQSMLADLFDSARRPLALGIFSSAAAISGLLLLPLFGFFAQNYGWRATFILAGCSGFLIAICQMVFLREPPRGGSEPKNVSLDPVPLRETLQFLAGSPAYLLIIAGSTLMGGFVFMAATWEPTFLYRVHSFNLAEVAMLIGPIRGVTGVVGLIGGGMLAKRLAYSENRRALIMPISALSLAICETVFLLSDSRVVWVSALILSGVFLTLHGGLVYSSILGLAKPRMRSVAISLLLFISTIIGHTLGPLLVGVFTDMLDPVFGTHSIRYAMLLAPLFAVFGALLFYCASSRLERDMARVAGASPAAALA